MIYLVLSIVLFSVFSVSIVNGQTTYGTTWEETCTDGICTRTLYSGERYHQDSEGNWVNPSDIFKITKHQDDLTFHYDGIKGYYNVTFETGVIYNGNYYDFATIKQNYPELNFNFPTEKHPTYRKYAVNITDIDKTGIDKTKISDVTLTYKDHYGFTLSQLKKVGRKYYIKKTMALLFEDLIAKHPVSINLTERRIYISNISQNIISGNLYLDPTVQLQDADTENLADAHVEQSNNDTNYGSQTTLQIRDSSTDAKRTYIKFNISSLPSNIAIISSTFAMRNYIQLAASQSVSIYHVNDTTWNGTTESTLTWLNQPCGVNFDNASMCNLTAESSNSIKNTGWYTWTVTQMVNRSYNNDDKNVSIVLKSPETGSASVSVQSFSKEHAPAPYLNITYGEQPYWYDNQSSIVTTYSPTTLSEFNITWNTTKKYIDLVYFESNYSGTNTNYTINNDTYGGDIYNYSIILLAGNFYWKSYAQSGTYWNSTDKWEFTINTNDSTITNYELNDTYININQSVRVNITAPYYETLTVEVQTSGTSTNHTATYRDNNNYTLDLTKTQLGDSQANATIVNITKLYFGGNNYTSSSNSTTLNFSYGRATISHSYSPSEPSNLPGSTITFTIKYNTTDNAYIADNCSVTIGVSQYYLDYSGGTHTRSISTDGWTPTDYSYTISCINSSYRTKTDSGSFTLTGTDPGGAETEGGGGGGGGFTFPRTQEEAQQMFEESVEVLEPIIKPFESPVIRLEFAFLGITIVVAGYYQLSYKKRKKRSNRSVY